MKNKQLTYLVIGGIFAYLLTQNSRQNTVMSPQFSQAPIAPQVSTSQAWAQWINSIISIYGNVASLWQPGGPFFAAGVTPQQANDIMANAGFTFNAVTP